MGLLQQLWFNYGLLPRLGYRTRILGFGVTGLVVLGGCAIFGEWVPLAQGVGPWLGFVLLYLAILVAFTVTISWMMKRRGASYAERLGEYRRRRGL